MIISLKYTELLDMNYCVKKTHFKTPIQQIYLSRFQMLVSQSAEAFKLVSKSQLFIVTELSISHHKLLNEQLFGITALFLGGYGVKIVL